MSFERQYERAVEGGRRNAEGIRLVKNWCAHARIERFGGIGMIEAATGLPIGHLAMACDHADGGASYAWDIRDAALEFHDAHCKICPHREPVGLPNLSQWVGERDAEVAKGRAETDRAEREAAERGAARQAARTALRASLPPPAADVIDQIAGLEGDRDETLVRRLVETAALAPDAFSPPVREHLYDLIKAGEGWADEAALRALARLGEPPDRLAEAAATCLRRFSATRGAAAVLARTAAYLDAAEVPGVLPALISLASPVRGPLADDRRPRKTPLVGLYRRHADAVGRWLSESLGKPEPYPVGRAAAALSVLIPRDASLAARFGRDLVAKLARASWMPSPDDFHEDDDGSHAVDHVYDAVVAAFAAAPEDVDALIRSFRLGASPTAQTRLVSIYGRALRSGRFRRDRPMTDADDLAFKRLLWEATETNSDQVLRVVRGEISRDPHRLLPLAARSVDGLLGAALLLDGQLGELDKPRPEGATGLDAMERQTRRMMVRGLRDNFIRWAAAGAGANANPKAYLSVLDSLTEAQSEFAAAMLENAEPLMETVEGFKAVLPALYRGLVGSSVVGRGCAARLVGELSRARREDAPDLLMDAFVTTLQDPYVYVHKSAVRALSRFRPPPVYDTRVRSAVITVLLANAKHPDRDDLRLECISLLAGRYLTETELAGRSGAILVDVLRKMPPWQISNELLSLAHDMPRAPGMVELIAAALMDEDGHEHVRDHALQALSSLPSEVVRGSADVLAKLPPPTDWRRRYWVFQVVETLARAGAHVAAVELATGVFEAIPDTVRDRPQRKLFELLRTATEFEAALAADADEVDEIAARWRALKTEVEARREGS